MRLLFSFFLSFTSLFSYYGTYLFTVSDNECSSGLADYSYYSFVAHQPAPRCSDISITMATKYHDGEFHGYHTCEPNDPTKDSSRFIYIPHLQEWYNLYKFCALPCEPNPPRPDKELITDFPPLTEYTSDFEGCNDAVMQGTYEYNGQRYTDLTCWASSCETDPRTWELLGNVVNTPICSVGQILDANGTCVSLSSLLPPDFPTTDDKHGKSHSTSAPYDQTSCTGVINAPIGSAYLVWDYASNSCQAVVYECNTGYLFDKNSMSCILPPDNIVDNGSCPGGTFLINYMSHLNFCNDDCSLQFPSWSPPVGYDDYNLLCGHSYTEYRCSSDYRVKKFAETSCSSTPNTHNMTIQPDDTVQPNDSDTTNLPDVNSSQASISTISSLTSLNSKIDTVNDNLLNIEEAIKSLSSSGSLTGSPDINSTPDFNSSGDGLVWDMLSNDAKDGYGSVNNALSKAGQVFDSITDGWATLKATIDNGFTVPNMSVGTNPRFCATIMGREVCFDICPFISQHYSIFYFIFSIIFFSISIRIYLKALRIK